MSETPKEGLAGGGSIGAPVLSAPVNAGQVISPNLRWYQKDSVRRTVLSILGALAVVLCPLLPAPANQVCTVVGKVVTVVGNEVVNTGATPQELTKPSMQLPPLTHADSGS